MFKSVLLVVALTTVTVLALPKIKRQAFGQTTYNLPDGVEFIVGQVRSTFSCQGRPYGYYADQDNNCQIFHVCNPVVLADGTQEQQMFSFFCGNQTVFDQSKLVCSHFEDALPCSEAHLYLGVNDLFFRTERPPVRPQPQPAFQQQAPNPFILRTRTK
ncbi:hypothetical protein CHUAL_013685 [Chamberlinius hualienensis]